MALGERRAQARRESSRAYVHRWAGSVGAQVLVVDPQGDDGRLGEALAARGVEVVWAASLLDGLVAFGRLEPHVVIVAPEAGDGPAASIAAFVTTVRGLDVPCVVAVVDDGLRVDELGAAVLAGAAVLTGRPYDPARVWDLLARGPRPMGDHMRLRFGPLELDVAAFTVRVDGERIADLPLKEFELLRALMIHAPDVVTDDELREALWGDMDHRAGGNTISMHVTRLRARLAGAADVRRVRGRGYGLAV